MPTSGDRKTLPAPLESNATSTAETALAFGGSPHLVTSTYKNLKANGIHTILINQTGLNGLVKILLLTSSTLQEHLLGAMPVISGGAVNRLYPMVQEAPEETSPTWACLHLGPKCFFGTIQYLT